MFKSGYSPKTRVQLTTREPSRTKQAFKAECDINTIIARFLRTGQIDMAQRLEPRYGDCTGIEFQSAMLKVKEAQSLFSELPSAIRSRFRNEPAEFLTFIQDPNNRDEAIKLGLIEKPKATSTATAASTKAVEKPKETTTATAASTTATTPARA